MKMIITRNDHYFSSEENQEVTIGGVWCYTCIISVALLQHSVLLCVDFYLSAHVLIFFRIYFELWKNPCCVTELKKCPHVLIYVFMCIFYEVH